MKLTVITVTYRDPEGVIETLKSLEAFHELGRPWEHLLVDSSADETQSALLALRKDWPLKHHVVPAKGIYHAMNEGIAASTGDALIFLNGGDILLDAPALSRLCDELVSSALDMICGSCYLTKNGQKLYPKHPKSTFLASILYRNQLSHQAVLYRRSAMTTVGGFNTNFRIAADYEHYFRCYAAGMKVKCVREVLVACDLTGTSSIRWYTSLTEAAEATAAIRNLLPRSIYWRHQFFSRLEISRVFLVKVVAAALPFSWARRFWVSWHLARTPRARHKL